MGPGVAGRAFTVVGRAPRSPLPWSQESVDDGLQSALADHQQLVAGQWAEAFEDLDEDVLGEVAQEARQDGQDPARAVDVFVRSLVRQLEDWKRADAVLAKALDEAALGRALPVWAADALAAEQGRLWGARQALLEAVARHHHGGPAPW
ncbi:hypothetical protein GCM10009639_61970 [Kitasatospora putterlickiae]|uniref:Uncharacterized protein n=1 Tax=Kitasatospora putterlickiae TaxID=221725 RepID=A0ABN1YFT0_9ACTN